MATSIARRASVGIATSAAAAALLLGAAGPASATFAGATTTSFNNACVGQITSPPTTAHQVEPFSVTANHVGVAPAGSTNTFRIQTGAQTTPGSAFGYTFRGLEKIRLVYTVDPATFVSASIVGSGSGFSGTPQLTLSGTKLVLQGTGTTGLSVGASTTYQLPEIEVLTTNPVLDVKFDTTGTAAQYGNYSANYFTFISKAKPWIGAEVRAETSCIPANGPLGDPQLSTYPTLNAGATAPSHP
ncbi:hypothetical protein ERC79_07355 [Rhodococcus sp. ABRD24]|uniref:hypothetical protein n=1 Tax=Rhodococcus sp. ABRD24 TaxID=2507582 RepID=UPI001040CAC8|nr:hypothetical protein [Rhodococcus sp. ABRD24]QBJ95802.1 hypothetical protein ERC79_07355 [Rhodococcus sp. ABRD24]